MKTYRIAVVPGDGIGPEVLADLHAIVKGIRPVKIRLFGRDRDGCSFDQAHVHNPFSKGVSEIAGLFRWTADAANRGKRI